MYFPPIQFSTIHKQQQQQQKKGKENYSATLCIITLKIKIKIMREMHLLSVVHIHAIFEPAERFFFFKYLCDSNNISHAF